MLVTGASSGIGRAIAIAAARAGASVAITYRRNRDGAEATAKAVKEAQVLSKPFHLKDLVREIDRLLFTPA
jgi:NAD(P)-dependent dehydrogenase (short-subunit alcohol dehydrogenase family)